MAPVAKQGLAGDIERAVESFLAPGHGDDGACQVISRNMPVSRQIALGQNDQATIQNAVDEPTGDSRRRIGPFHFRRTQDRDRKATARQQAQLPLGCACRKYGRRKGLKQVEADVDLVFAPGPQAEECRINPATGEQNVVRGLVADAGDEGAYFRCRDRGVVHHQVIVPGGIRSAAVHRVAGLFQLRQQRSSDQFKFA